VVALILCEYNLGSLHVSAHTEIINTKHHSIHPEIESDMAEVSSSARSRQMIEPRGKATLQTR
jgi:hypothetical protein